MSVWRRDFGALFRLYLVIGLVQFVALQAPLQTSLRTLSTRKPESAEDLAWLVPLFLGMIALVLATMFLASWGLLIGSHFVAARRLGARVALGDSIRRGGGRLLSLLGAFIVSGVLGIVACCITTLPAVLLTTLVITAVGKGALPTWVSTVGVIVLTLLVMLGVLGGLFWYFVRFFLLPTVVGLEDGGVWRSIKRSGALVSGRVAPGLFGRSKVRVTLLLTVLGVLLFAVSTLASLPALIIQFLYANPFTTDPSRAHDLLPQHLMIPAQLFGTIVSAVFAPMGAVLAGVFYVDQRVRREGLDLEQRLDALRPRT